MFIDDYDNYIEKNSLQNELKNVKEQLKAAHEENAVLRSSNLMISGNAIKLKQLLIEKNEKIKDLESEIDELKKNPSAAPDAEWIAIHTADVNTINKLNIKVHDLNNTITTLLDILSKSTDENQELKKKVQELKDITKDLVSKLYK